MLTITVPDSEAFDNDSGKFVKLPEVTLQLEHSLVSVSKWESTFEKPFLVEGDKSTKELLWYVKAMTLTPDIPDEVYDRLSNQNLIDINNYIGAKMTATWFAQIPNTGKSNSKGETVTSELVYYWMIALNIPFECQNWHLSRLLTLIEVCNRKNSPQKKMSRAEIAARNRALNAQRRQQYNTKG